MKISPRYLLITEFFLIFIITPIFFALYSEFSPVFVLVVFGVPFALYLKKDREFDNTKFFSLQGLKKELPRITFFFSIVLLILFLYTMLVYPESVFFCIKNNPRLWLLIMLAYPLLSVYPQELIYRGFIMRRYGCLFRSESGVIHLSAISFSFAHIIYFHPISVILTLGGGYLFAWTYKRTGSLLIASVEHAMYGCSLFTIGLGRFFYAGFDKMMN